ISENDRGTPGTGHVHWDETFRTLRKLGYDGWLVIEAFGRALPDLAAATKVWRDLFPSDVEVYTQGLRFMKQMWGKYGKGNTTSRKGKGRIPESVAYASGSYRSAHRRRLGSGGRPRRRGLLELLGRLAGRLQQLVEHLAVYAELRLREDAADAEELH